jgi:hypothetical protein
MDTTADPTNLTGQAIEKALAPTAPPPANPNVQAALKSVGTDGWSPESISAGLTDFQKRIQQGEQQFTEDYAKKTAEQEKASAAIESQFHPLPPRDTTKFTGLMLVLGALAGRNTMASMTAAMNNITGILKGQKDGNDEMVKSQKEQFEMNFKNGIEKAKLIADEKQQLLDKYKYDQGAMQEEYNIFKLRHGIGDSVAKEDMFNTKQMYSQIENMEKLQTALMLGMQKQQTAEQIKRPMITYKDASGKTVERYLNEQEMAGAALPEGAEIVAGTGAAKGAGNAQVAVRTKIVQAGAINAINRLNEIQKKFGSDATASSFFGTHGENPITKGLYGAGRSAQSQRQQEIDSDWGSFIDEAIPVFTGGLRGSDSFRQFLIQQAPQPGDKPGTVAEKVRLFRENINGSSKVFFNKFASDPNMWAPGTKPEDVQGGAPSSSSGEWKVERVQ